MSENKEVQKKTSIIIPAVKIDYLLKNCIKEIRKLYDEVIIVLVLDEDKDGDIYEKDKNIKIYKSENKNMSAKRNMGVSYSKTEYIALIDSDAFPGEGWLENSINFLEMNSDYCAVTGRQWNFPDDDLEQRYIREIHYSPIFTHDFWRIIIDEKAKEQDCTEFSTANVILRKSIYDKLGGMKEEIYLAEDNEFSERIVKSGNKIRFLPDVFVYHREEKAAAYFKKIYCMSYYYANMFLKGKNVKTLKQAIMQFVPLIGLIGFIILLLVLAVIRVNILPFFILPIMALIIFAMEANRIASKFKEFKLKSFIILFTYCLIFTGVWILGSITGLLNIKTNIYNLYKQY